MKKMVFVWSLLLMAMALGCGKAEEAKVESAEYSLKDAYNDLAKLPYMQTQAEKDSLWLHINSEYVDSLEAAYAKGLDKENVHKVGQDMFGILDKVGLQNMIIGGSNQYMAGLVYAKPIADGKYDLLVVGASGELGYIAVEYGIVDKATVDTIQGANLTLNMSQVVIPISENVNLVNMQAGN